MVEESDIKILADFRFSASLVKKVWPLEHRQYVCTDLRLALARKVGPTLFIRIIYEFVHRRSVSSERKHSSNKKRGPSDRPQNTK
jgi:hypothetical protein